MPCLSCSTSLALVAHQRDRMANYILTKSIESIQHAARMCANECVHAYLYRVAIAWVRAKFFPTLALSGLMEPAEAPASPCTLTCLFRFRTDIVTFVRSFVSYSKPICMLHVKHVRLLQHASTCCKSFDTTPYTYCLDDLSMHIFRAANAEFFKGQLTHKNFNSPQHLLRIAEGLSPYPRILQSRPKPKAYEKALVVPPDYVPPTETPVVSPPSPVASSPTQGQTQGRVLRSRVHETHSMERRAGETNQQLFARIVNASKEEAKQEEKGGGGDANVTDKVDANFLPAFLDGWEEWNEHV